MSQTELAGKIKQLQAREYKVTLKPLKSPTQQLSRPLTLSLIASTPEKQSPTAFASPEVT